MQITSSENKVLVRWLIEELFNRKRTEVTRFLYASECRGNTPDGSFANRHEFLAGFAHYAAAFPNFRVEIDNLVADEDRVAVHYTFVGANTGSWAGLPPTGQMVRIGGAMISRISHSRIIQQDFVWDVLSARRQFWIKPARPSILRSAA
ncbi:MAG: hypothetical protein C5B51_12710 [Terriglobia bacterium]|nr:MAG: hypothetical protein C5B51_12710 [Terriglobia bacterium]